MNFRINIYGILHEIHIILTNAAFGGIVRLFWFSRVLSLPAGLLTPRIVALIHHSTLGTRQAGESFPDFGFCPPKPSIKSGVFRVVRLPEGDDGPSALRQEPPQEPRPRDGGGCPAQLQEAGQHQTVHWQETMRGRRCGGSSRAVPPAPPALKGSVLPLLATAHATCRCRPSSASAQSTL